MIAKISLTAAFLLMVAPPMACASSRDPANFAPTIRPANESPLGIAVAQDDPNVGTADSDNGDDSDSDDSADDNQNADGNQNPSENQADPQNAAGDDQSVTPQVLNAPGGDPDSAPQVDQAPQPEPVNPYQ
ncbi:MAG: hypothetical protein ACREQH_01440 [Candidatus Binatus sp.]